MLMILFSFGCVVDFVSGRREGEEEQAAEGERLRDLHAWGVCGDMRG